MGSNRKKDKERAVKSAAKRKNILKGFFVAQGQWRPVCLDGGHGYLGPCMSAAEADRTADAHRLQTGDMADKENC